MTRVPGLITSSVTALALTFAIGAAAAEGRGPPGNPHWGHGDRGGEWRGNGRGPPRGYGPRGYPPRYGYAGPNAGGASLGGALLGLGLGAALGGALVAPGRAYAAPPGVYYPPGAPGIYGAPPPVYYGY